MHVKQRYISLLKVISFVFLKLLIIKNISIQTFFGTWTSLDLPGSYGPVSTNKLTGKIKEMPIISTNFLYVIALKAL